jgi:plasmid stabilization system protein ParE
MKLRFTERAFSDREDIYEYLAERSPTAARDVYGYLTRAIRRLSEMPYSGVQTDEEDVRVLFIVRYPYKVFYRIREQAVEILHIRHSSRRPPENE